jgi:Glycosyl hydrolase family 3 C-terminal domain
VNPNTIVVLNTSDPVAMPWLGSVKAVLEMWHPGDTGGYATANSRMTAGRGESCRNSPLQRYVARDLVAPHLPARPLPPGEELQVRPGRAETDRVAISQHLLGRAIQELTDELLFALSRQPVSYPPTAGGATTYRNCMVAPRLPAFAGPKVGLRQAFLQVSAV